MSKEYSIIIPVYNCSKYLSRCIESIVNQQITNYEVILIDDGSTDESPEICDLYRKKYEWIKVIHQKNQGVSHARNTGLMHASGKYLLFLDADDYWNPNYILELNEIIKATPEVELFNFGFFSDIENENLDTISSDKIIYREIKYISHEEIKSDFINLWDNTMLYNIWNKVYLRKIIIEHNIKFPNYNWGEDVEFNKLYLNQINTLYNSDQCYYHYVRERKGAATNSLNLESFNIRKKEFQEFNEYFESWGIDKSKYYEFSCRRYIERILGCIENVYSANLNFMMRYKEVKKMINDSITNEALKYVEPKSQKIKIMLIPLKLKSTLLTMFMGRISNFVKSKFPSLFNRLKNRR